MGRIVKLEDGRLAAASAHARYLQRGGATAIPISAPGAFCEPQGNPNNAAAQEQGEHGRALRRAALASWV